MAAGTARDPEGPPGLGYGGEGSGYGSRGQIDGPSGSGGASPSFQTSSPQPAQSPGSFLGMSHSAEAQFADYPPDTQVAAGPSLLMEMTNVSWSVWTKEGSLVSEGSLASFFGLPAGFAPGDPQLLFDALSNRWFASCVAVNANGDSRLYLAVSQSSDPTGSWKVYLGPSKTGVVMDQPMLGMTSDKAVLSWNDYSGAVPGTDSGGQFVGQEVSVLDKGALLSGAGIQSVEFGPDTSRYRLVPARSASPGKTAYLVYSRPQNASSLGIVAVDGTPASNDVTWNETDVSVAAIARPPGAAQPQGPKVDTGDSRITSVVWQNGILWAVGDDACGAGSGQPHSCLRMIEISMQSTPSVLQDFEAGSAGTDSYYPSVAMDAAGNMFVVFTESSSSMYPSVAVAGQASSAASGTLSEPSILQSGAGSYDCGICFTSDRNGVRWGDYSSAAVDPSNPSVVWLAGEYAASSTDPTDWGTAIGPYSFAAGASAPTGVRVSSTPTALSTATLTLSSTPTAVATPLPTATATVMTGPTPSSMPAATARPLPTPTNAPTPRPTSSATAHSPVASLIPISAHLLSATVRRNGNELLFVLTRSFAQIVLQVQYPISGGFHTHGMTNAGGAWKHRWIVRARNDGRGTLTLLVIYRGVPRHYTLHFQVAG